MFPWTRQQGHLGTLTGGEGVITQWVHGEFIVSFETICLVNTHQVCVEYFLKLPCISLTFYPLGTWWVLCKSTH